MPGSSTTVARRIALRAPLLAAGLGLAFAAAAEPGAEPSSAAEIDACMRANFPERSSVQEVAFRARDREGAETESRATIYWRKSEDGLSNVMVRFATPLDLRGAGLLILEKQDARRDMFMYLPELRKSRRVTTRMMSGSMFGTDFSYEDFERFQGFEKDARKERLEDAYLDANVVWVVESRPGADDGSSYEKILQYVDREKCVPLKTEFYEEGSRLRKVATSDPARISREASGWVPRILTIRDLRDETETDLVVDEMRVDEPIPEKMFSQRELEAGAR